LHTEGITALSVKDPYKARKRPETMENEERETGEVPEDIPKTTKLRIDKSKKQDE
jgi:hypothetical protein